MEALLATVRALGGAFLDPWAVLDAGNRVVAFDARFRGLFARHQARKLEGSACCAFLAFSVCGGGPHLATRCLEAGHTLRFDEIEARLEGEVQPRRFTLAVTPIGHDLTLLAARDVTDVASMQQKYRDLHVRETREIDSVKVDLVRKTKELLDTHMELNRVQQELTRFKKGLFG